MAINEGFISKNKVNIQKDNKSKMLNTGNITIEVIGDPSNRIFIMQGSATPTTPIELTAKQNINIIKYPGLDDKQAQICGFEYDPIVLSGKIDYQDMQRGFSNIEFNSNVDRFGYKTEFISDRTIIDLFFKELLKVQQEGFQTNLIVEVFEQNSKSDYRNNIVQGYTSHNIRCLISEIKYSCHLYGVWNYNITFIPISPANQKFVQSQAVNQKTTVGKIKDFKKSIDEIISVVDESIQNFENYANIVHNSLASISQELSKIENITNSALNLANLPASSINQTLNISYQIKTFSEELCENVTNLKTNYEIISRAANWEWDGPAISDAVKNATIESELLFIQRDLLKSNVSFDPTFVELFNSISENKLVNPDKKPIKDLQYEINKFETHYEQKVLDRNIRNSLSKMLLVIKRFIKENEIKSPYTTYVCKQHDTLRSIANKSYNDVTKWRQIADFNNLDGDDLTAGQNIRIPIL